jgi:hypothetical protein
MSVTAFDNEAASKSLEDAGFTDVQIAALMGCMRQPHLSGARQPLESAVPPSRKPAPEHGGSLTHAIAMMVLAVGGLGALLAILVRVA